MSLKIIKVVKVDLSVFDFSACRYNSCGHGCLSK